MRVPQRIFLHVFQIHNLYVKKKSFRLILWNKTMIFTLKHVERIKCWILDFLMKLLMFHLKNAMSIIFKVLVNFFLTMCKWSYTLSSLIGENKWQKNLKVVMYFVIWWPSIWRSFAVIMVGYVCVVKIKSLIITFSIKFFISDQAWWRMSIIRSISWLDSLEVIIYLIGHCCSVSRVGRYE